MDFKPNGPRLLVKTTEEEQKSESGFILPTKEKGDLASAKVIEVGQVDGEFCCHYLLNKTVYFKEGDGHKITLDGENYLVLDNEKVLGFV